MIMNLLYVPARALAGFGLNGDSVARPRISQSSGLHFLFLAP